MLCDGREIKAKPGIRSERPSLGTTNLPMETPPVTPHTGGIFSFWKQDGPKKFARVVIISPNL